MPGRSPRLDWQHLQNWLPGVLGVFAVISLVVIAANSPTQTNSKLAEGAPSQSTAAATKGQTGALPTPSQPAAPQASAAPTRQRKLPHTAAAGRYHRRSCQTAGDA